MFVTPYKIRDVKEGQDFLLRCLLTDPSVTNLTLQAETSATCRKLGWTGEMNVTLDPKRGALIRNPQKEFNGCYVCSGWKDGRRFKSKPLDMLVVSCKTCLYTCLSGHLLTCWWSVVKTCMSICLQGCVILPLCLSVMMNRFVWKERSLRSPV